MEIDTKNIPAIRRTLEVMKDGPFTKALFNEIGLYIRTRIIARTSFGKDYQNKPFIPYSPKYAEFRFKHGRPTAPVDLQFTGDMLGPSGMTYNATDSNVRVFFTANKTPGTKATHAEKAYYNQQTRTFFRLSKRDIEGIMLIVQSKRKD